MMSCKGCSPESHRQHLDAWKASGIVDVVMRIGGYETFHPCGAVYSSRLTECRQCHKMLVFKSFVVELLYRKQEIVDKGQEQQGECRLCGRIPAWVAMEKGEIERDEEFKSIELEVRISPTDHQTRTDLILKYDKFKPSPVVPLSDPRPTTPTSTTSGTPTPTSTPPAPAPTPEPTQSFDTTAVTSLPLVNVAAIGPHVPNATTTSTNSTNSNHKRKTLASPKKEQKRARLPSTPVDFYGEFQMSSVMVAESVLEAVKNKRSNITYRVFNRNKKTDSILSLSDDRKTWRILCLVEDDQIIVKETFDFSRGIVALERIVTRGVIRVEGIKKQRDVLSQWLAMPPSGPVYRIPVTNQVTGEPYWLFSEPVTNAAAIDNGHNNHNNHNNIRLVLVRQTDESVVRQWDDKMIQGFIEQCHRKLVKAEKK